MKAIEKLKKEIGQETDLQNKTMNLKHIFKISFTALKTNKSRSALTILGIVIGITAIIMVMALGQGAQDLIIGEIQGIGSRTMIIMPGRQMDGFSDTSMMDSLFNDSLKERDLKSLERKENAPYLSKLIPVVFGTEAMSYEGETYRSMIMGSSENIADVYKINPVEGSFFTKDDVIGLNNVVVIGNKVKNELFGESDAVGKKIKIKGMNFRVIGVLPSKGSASFMNFDDSVFAPYTTTQTYILGIKYFQRVIAEAETEDTIAQTVKDIETTLRNNHNITDPEKDDFNVETQADLVKTVGQITGILTLFLAAVASISLLVGGIGIMNIMLVSVTERTREIGLRKAIGATEKNILTQFLVEAIGLTAVGGIIGIILGATFSFLTSLGLSRVLAVNWKFNFPISAVILGLGVSSFVGLIFGIYPAKKAASKSPMEALRYE